MTKRVKASEFKAKCLKIMDEVAETGEAVVITKHGKAVSRLVPFTEPVPTLFGLHAGKVAVRGDLIVPSGESWDADG